MSTRAEITTVFRVTGAGRQDAAFTFERAPSRARVAERKAEAYGGPVSVGRPASPAETDHERQVERFRECLAVRNLDVREEETLIVSGVDRATLETARR